jgi:hypothetical protein
MGLDAIIELTLQIYSAKTLFQILFCDNLSNAVLRISLNQGLDRRIGMGLDAMIITFSYSGKRGLGQ